GSAADDPDPQDGVGYADWVQTVPGFKKLRFRTHENIGFGPVNLPDLELQTVAAWWAVPDCILSDLEPVLRAHATLAAGHAMQHVGAMLLMCEVSDLGHAVASGTPSGGWSEVVDARRPRDETLMEAMGAPCIYLYDDVAGGVGLSARLHAMGEAFFSRVLATVSGCPCSEGCPTCLGSSWAALDSRGRAGRAPVLRLLEALAEAAR
ncbi:MAG: DUF1998 domain-containing protein, partial [Deltaproteobacteria bacterium]|nr:DUF1998 domain-containing protein [Deltaproteobacteria bacterium]